MLSKVERNRYHRQMLLPEIDEAGQLALSKAKVLIVGLGGLGHPVASYLAAAGIGTLGLVDGDTVDVSNLHRQVLFTTADVGKNKAEVAFRRLSARNEFITYKVFPEFISKQNAHAMIGQFDMVVDASDNFATRYLIADICHFLEKPLVFGAVHQFEGQVSVFNVEDQLGLSYNYRDLFPFPPESHIPNCAEAGVLGALPGLVGSMQAIEVLKLLLGQDSIAGKLVHIDVLTMNWLKLSINQHPQNPLRQNGKEYFDELNYEQHCHVLPKSNLELGIDEFSAMVREDNTIVVDVREEDEIVLNPICGAIHHAMSAGFDWLDHVAGHDRLVFVCRSGRRSLAAADIAIEKGLEAYSLMGGEEENRDQLSA